MGCFDYECSCGGETCEHVGGQLHDSNVVIEVPLSDGTNVYLEGHYEQYGYVTVGDYQFYPEQFREYFEGWFEDEDPKNLDKNFLANRIWTLNETVYKYIVDEDDDEHDVQKFVRRTCFDRDVNVSKLDPSDLSKYIRADKGVDLDRKRKQRIEKLKATIEFMQKELGRVNKP